MDRGLSSKIVWVLAAEEAMASHFEFIEIPHIFIAILKFAEMNSNDLGPHARDRHSKRFFAEEQEATQDLLDKHHIVAPEDSTSIRRALRARIGQSDFKAGIGWTIHRSGASRRIAKAAEQIARDADSRLVKASHVLEAVFDTPSRTMIRVLEDAGAIAGPIDDDTLI